MTIRPRKHGQTTILGLFALLLFSIAVLWSWNSVMAELLGRAFGKINQQG